MKRLFLGAIILAGFSAALATARADISVDFFYNNLSDGNWVEVGDYGYCWQPEVAVSNRDWRPYADGYWAYTDDGWTWISYEGFGWATYHYGRWAHLSDMGWVWVPGRDEDLAWGPAWVSWRTGDQYVGWAPLPPTRERVYEGRAISGDVDVEMDIGPAYYNFIDVRYIGEPVLRERIVPVSQNVTYVTQTVNVTNITYQNSTVYNYGPDINVVSQQSARPIQRLTIQRQANVDFAAAASSGGLNNKVQGQSLIVAAPSRISKPARQIAPPSIKTRVASPKLDTGWSAVGDVKAQEDFKQKLRDRQANRPAQTGAAAAATTAGASSSPAAATATAAARASVAPSAAPLTSPSAPAATPPIAPGTKAPKERPNRLGNAGAPATVSPAAEAPKGTVPPKASATIPPRNERASQNERFNRRGGNTPHEQGESSPSNAAGLPPEGGGHHHKLPPTGDESLKPEISPKGNSPLGQAGPEGTENVSKAFPRDRHEATGATAPETGDAAGRIPTEMKGRKNAGGEGGESPNSLGQSAGPRRALRESQGATENARPNEKPQHERVPKGAKEASPVPTP